MDAALAKAVISEAHGAVVTNVDAQPHRRDFAPLLSAQLCSPVRWRQSLVTLAQLGARLFVELGPGTELSGMVRRTLPDALRGNVAAPEDVDGLGDALSALYP